MRARYEEVSTMKHSLYFFVLRQIVPRAQYLNVFRILRRPALRIRDDVVEMKILFAATLNTAAFISLPSFQLNCGRNNSIVVDLLSRTVHVNVSLIYDFKFELEHLSPVRGLLPSIHQSE